MNNDMNKSMTSNRSNSARSQRSPASNAGGGGGDRPLLKDRQKVQSAVFRRGDSMSQK